MDANFSNAADDFFINLDLQTTLPLPTGRETVLHFFEAVRRQFSQMTNFYRREQGEFVLEGDRESGTYPWLELQENRMVAGYFNPPETADAYELHRWLLDRSGSFLGLGGLDIECLDLTYGFNLEYRGNRDSIVAEALLGGSPLAGLLGGQMKAVEFEPSLVVAMDEQCSSQARLSLETRSNSQQVRTGQYSDEPISIYFTVRRYPTPGKILDMIKSLSSLCTWGEELVTDLIIPQVVRPLAVAIATAP